MNVNLLLGDCLECMAKLPEASVDLVLSDPPYGTTACKWDSVIPFEPMWAAVKPLLKPNRPVVLFGQEPFSSALRLSNVEQFKYDWYWRKTRPSGFTNARLRPLKDIEVISVFSEGAAANGSPRNMPYNPQGVGAGYLHKRSPESRESRVSPYRKSHKSIRVTHGSNYPRQVLEFKNHNVGNVHPTQKPVDLMEYLVRTYSDEGDTVLDFTMGSGTTGVACVRAGRRFVGIENSPEYFELAQSRIESELSALTNDNEGVFS